MDKNIQEELKHLKESKDKMLKLIDEWQKDLDEMLKKINEKQNKENLTW